MARCESGSKPRASRFLPTGRSLLRACGNGVSRRLLMPSRQSPTTDSHRRATDRIISAHHLLRHVTGSLAPIPPMPTNRPSQAVMFETIGGGHRPGGRVGRARATIARRGSHVALSSSRSAPSRRARAPKPAPRSHRFLRMRHAASNLNPDPPGSARHRWLVEGAHVPANLTPGDEDEGMPNPAARSRHDRRAVRGGESVHTTGGREVTVAAALGACSSCTASVGTGERSTGAGLGARKAGLR